MNPKKNIAANSEGVHRNGSIFRPHWWGPKPKLGMQVEAKSIPIHSATNSDGGGAKGRGRGPHTGEGAIGGLAAVIAGDFVGGATTATAGAAAGVGEGAGGGGTGWGTETASGSHHNINPLNSPRVRIPPLRSVDLEQASF